MRPGKQSNESVPTIEIVRYRSRSTKQLAACNRKPLQLQTGEPETRMRWREMSFSCKQYDVFNNCSR